MTSAGDAYAAPYFAPGIYRLTAEAAGFRGLHQTGIEVRSGEVPRADVKVELDAVTESIIGLEKGKVFGIPGQPDSFP